MSGSTNRKHLFIYRPNTTITQITLVGQTTDSTINAPANQSLDMSLQTGPYIGMAIYMSSGNITTRGSTVTETREINNGSAQTNYTKTFEATSSSVSFANSTISMADYGTNALVSFMLQII
jgi:hypothetical protein